MASSLLRCGTRLCNNTMEPLPAVHWGTTYFRRQQKNGSSRGLTSLWAIRTTRRRIACVLPTRRTTFSTLNAFRTTTSRAVTTGQWLTVLSICGARRESLGSKMVNLWSALSPTTFAYASETCCQAQMRGPCFPSLFHRVRLTYTQLSRTHSDMDWMQLFPWRLPCPSLPISS